MRKHDVRKWLHAILDLLPVILIPVFMIYSHRHVINDGSIDVPQNEVVDFNQLVVNGLPSSIDTYSVEVLSNNTISYVDGSIKYELINYVGSWQNGFGNYHQFNIVDNHIYFSSLTFKSNLSCYVNVRGDGGSPITRQLTLPANHWTTFDYIFTSFNDTSGANRYFYPSQNDVTLDNTFVLYLTNNMLIDLTQMFGVGNEPSVEQFRSWYNLSYYSYTLSHKELLKNSSTITYSDTDIMSQFTYQLYNSVDKYFNVGNVFHLGEVYDWFNLNIFNGNAPIYIYVVYQIVLYELIMDLLFLLYGLFMWFIDMIQKLMEKPLNSVR